MGEKHLEQIQQKIQEELLAELEQGMSFSDEEMRDEIELRVLKYGQIEYLTIEEKLELAKKIFNSIRRLDVLEELLEDPDITEIMVNGPEHIFIEKDGKLMDSGKKFQSRSKLEDVIQQIVSKVNRVVNEASPIVDVRLLDGSRVNVVLPPVALDGPVMTIRRFPETPFHMDKLLELGSITQEAADFLRTLVEARYNIFISGGTGSGKTTFLNVLSNYIPVTERIVTIRDLVRSALRQRPDRIIIGEIRDAAVIELLSAMNTGHDGSISTGHANSPADMLRRMETLVLTGMEIPLAAVRSQIASAIEIVVQLGRLRDKSRKVLEIDEVCGIDPGEIVLRPLYQFRETENSTRERVEGRLMTTGNSLLNRRKLVMAGKERTVEIS